VIRADLDVFGHLHQYTPLRYFVTNGSMPGYTPYGMALSTFNKGEPPTQAFFLLDKKRSPRVGPTVRIPIVFDD
jgi:hypothetical protein